MTREAHVAEALMKAGKRVAVAESTTGGYIGHLLNNVPGSSKYFIGGVVAYSNQPKMHVLKVPEHVLKETGSVSAQTALAMAQGVRVLMQADIGVAETGIAGPSHGSPEKPVGTVFMAISTKDGYELVERSVWQTDRMGFKEKTAEAVFSLVEHYLARKTA
jgi:PncC family amidohydrolase